MLPLALSRSVLVTDIAFQEQFTRRTVVESEDGMSLLPQVHFHMFVSLSGSSAAMREPALTHHWITHMEALQSFHFPVCS